MLIESVRKDYYRHRIRRLKGDPARLLLGEREMLTLLAILGWKDCPQAFSNKMIVDLGCGDQYIKTAIERRKGIYLGLDIDDCNFEIDSIPLASASADIVVCLALIEHLYDPSLFLSECLRILKPGGYLWLSTPDIQACGAKFWNDPTHVHPYTRQSLRTLLLQHGFKDSVVCPNFRCMPKSFYQSTGITFFLARHVMLLSGASKFPIPGILKGRCTGMFGIARKPITEECI